MIYNQFRNHSGRLVINFSKVPSLLYWWYKRRIIKKFDLKPVTKIVEDLDVKFQTFQSENGYKISLEWDNWSGFLIVSLDEKSENFVLKIANFLGYSDQSNK